MDSKLQIISGAFRGRKLYLPDGARPTQNRARIALFNMLGALGGDYGVVWDAFAGSGAFGIECLSRGAKSVFFTDTAPESIKTIRKNLAELQVGDAARVMPADAMTAATTVGAGADLIFIDPPYASAQIGAALVRRLGTLARPGTIVVWEQDAPAAVTPSDENWEILRDKRYGRARFLILRKK